MIYKDVIVGDNSQISKNVHLGAGSKLGSNSHIGESVSVAINAKIGDNVLVSSNSDVYFNVEIENGSFFDNAPSEWEIFRGFDLEDNNNSYQGKSEKSINNHSVNNSVSHKENPDTNQESLGGCLFIIITTMIGFHIGSKVSSGYLAFLGGALGYYIGVKLTEINQK